MFPGTVKHAEISHNGSILAVSSDHSLYIYHANGKGALILVEKLNYTNAVIGLSDDGHRLFVSNSTELHLHKWKGKHFHKLSAVALSNPVVGVRISENLHTAAVATSDGVAVYRECSQDQWASGSTCLSCNITGCDYCVNDTVCSSCSAGYEIWEQRCVLAPDLNDHRALGLGLGLLAFLAIVVIGIFVFGKAEVAPDGQLHKAKNGIDDRVNNMTMMDHELGE